MSDTRPARASSITGDLDGAVEISHVLDGVALDGVAGRLARALDPAFLDEAGWDPRTRVLSLPAGHPLLGWRVCPVEGCLRTVRGAESVCPPCLTRLTGLGMSAAEIAAATDLPAGPAPVDDCSVPGCQHPPRNRQVGLCHGHAQLFRNRRPPVSREQFLDDPRVRPFPPLPECAVEACTRPADGAGSDCNAHQQRWWKARQTDPGLDHRWWQVREPAVPEPGQVNLRAMPVLVVVEVLFGLQQRVRSGAKIKNVELRALCAELRRQQVTTLAATDVELIGKTSGGWLLTAMTRHVRRALADPDTEAAKDTWDLAVFGHRGTVSFTGIAQPWLAQTAKRWAAEQLPRHRSAGGAQVRVQINALGLLSEYLSCRPDRGHVAAELGRRDIEGFLNRLAFLESTGEISRNRRLDICRDVRKVLDRIRALGLTRPGGPAAGLVGDFTLERSDIPAEPDRDEPGRDLPPEIIATLCAHLDALEPVEVRVLTELVIDTGRRPEDVLGLPVDCLGRDTDGGAVLVYDNLKADRMGRRLPISAATAAVITAQQERVRARFPDTAAAQLKLLPSTRRNPHGTTAMSIEMLDDRHRRWADSLPTLRTRDGAEFDKTKIFPYAWRHSYAQRHADAGVPVDVLADLLDHGNLNVTRRWYYRVGEDRRRAAVDTVTALSFDRHGNRIWRGAAALLESEHARFAVGEVAVPYGRCREPSNVQAGGGACPVRFRCVGCDHFRTTVAHLPDLQAYLEDLLGTRERLAAAVSGVDEWARADALPTQEEITRIRWLITRINDDVAELDDTERAQIRDAVAVVRRHRAAHAVPLGMPTLRAAPPRPLRPATPEATA